jgi:hypothetical protein
MLQLADNCCVQVPLCGWLIYCLVGACLEASFVWVVWPSVCVVVGVPYFMMLSFSVLSGYTTGMSHLKTEWQSYQRLCWQNFSPDDVHDVLETCRELKIKINTYKRIVRRVGYLIKNQYMMHGQQNLNKSNVTAYMIAPQLRHRHSVTYIIPRITSSTQGCINVYCGGECLQHFPNEYLVLVCISYKHKPITAQLITVQTSLHSHKRCILLC